MTKYFIKVQGCNTKSPVVITKDGETKRYDINDFCEVQTYNTKELIDDLDNYRFLLTAQLSYMEINIYKVIGWRKFLGKLVRDHEKKPIYSKVF